MHRPLFAFVALSVLLLGTPPAFADAPYVVSPRASEATKAAVAAGEPPAHGFPEIHAVAFKNPTALRPGTQIDATVDTSPNVHYVEGRVKYWNIAFEEVGNGRFVLHYKVPFLPPNALGHWDLQVIARSVDGVEVKRSFPVTYRYF